MPQIVEVPGYGDVEFPDGMTDDQIASAIKANMSPTQAPAIPFSGGGFGNVLMNRFQRGGERAMDELGMTPENVANPIANAAGPLEVGLQGATGLLSTIGGGVAGIGQGLWNTVVPKSMEGMPAADRVQQIQRGGTYQPRTGMGAAASRVVGAPGELWQAGTNKAGEFVTDKTGLPSLGAAIKTAGDVAPAFLTRGNPFGEGAVPARTAPRADYVRREDAPAQTPAQLKAAAEDAYKASDAAGVVIRPESTQRVVTMLDDIAEKENLGKLPPKMKEARDILTARIEEGKALSLRDADKVRQLINDAKKSTDAADQRLASIAQERYDAYIDGLGPNDTLAGNTAQGVAMLKTARDLHRRRRNAELFEQIDEVAETKGSVNYTQAGESLALRQQFARIANNPRELSKYSPEEQAAIKRVARGTAAENTLRNLGKIDPSRGGMAHGLNTIIGGGLGGAVGSMAGPVGAGAGAVGGIAALGVGANLANRQALKMTRRNVESARKKLTEPRRGLLDSDAPLVQERGPLAGEVMPRPPLALPAPNIIAGSRSAPGTAFAREQMGLTPDVERAGLLHPGMARENVQRPPLALPFIREEAKPMVVDPSGRVAPTAGLLDDYLLSTGLRETQKANRPGGLLARQGSRPSKEIRADIQRLVREVAGEPANSPQVRKALEQLESLRRELAASQANR